MVEQVHCASGLGLKEDSGGFMLLSQVDLSTHLNYMLVHQCSSESFLK